MVKRSSTRAPSNELNEGALSRSRRPEPPLAIESTDRPDRSMDRRTQERDEVSATP